VANSSPNPKPPVKRGVKFLMILFASRRRIASVLAIVVATKDQTSCPLGDDIVILDLKAGLYFSLNNVGALVWQLIQQPRSVKDLRDAILATFDVEREVCERDLEALLRDLASRNLVEIRDAAAA
jgi:hypothetical protein